MLWKAKRKLTYKTVNHYYKEYRQMYRLRLEWLWWQESWQPLPTRETQIGICHQNQGYQWWAQRAGRSCRFFAFARSLIAPSLSSKRIMEPCIACGYQNLKSLKSWSTNVSYGKIYKKWGLSRWSSGQDSTLPMKRAWARSLVRKLDPTCHNQELTCYK